jgi:hypothetical protein
MGTCPRYGSTGEHSPVGVKHHLICAQIYVKDTQRDEHFQGMGFERRKAGRPPKRRCAAPLFPVRGVS